MTMQEYVCVITELMTTVSYWTGALFLGWPKSSILNFSLGKKFTRCSSGVKGLKTHGIILMCIGHVNSRHSNHCNVQCTCIPVLFSLSSLHFTLQLERSQFEQTVNHINGIFDEAERVGARTYLEGCLGCITAYLIFMCIQTQYNKVTTLKQ